jgi:hypothetical protein
MNIYLTLRRNSKTYLFFALLMLGSMHSAIATEKHTYQNWSVDIGSETAEAYTVGDTQSSFGFFCGQDTCIFYLNPNLNCQPGTKNPVLVNSASTSTAITMQCALIGGKYFQILEAFDVMQNAVKAGEFIGFSAAVQDGNFVTLRFSLRGAMQALQRTLDEAATLKRGKL